MRRVGLFLVLSSGALGGCQSAAFQRPEVGTPEYAAFLTSRGYDCGLPVPRGTLMARQAGEARGRYISAGQGFAVRAYRKPEVCGLSERAEVAAELRRLARR